jgi:uncharacterized Zn-binding protein involved in type VI secretion
MPRAHRDSDSRTCGAKTVVSGQGNVYVEGKLWAVNGDKNNHGNSGPLRSVVGSTVKINNIRVIVQGDQASPDAFHSEPLTWPSSFASKTYAY